MGSEGHVCPACGQPVETVVRRHKTLGAWVPLWVAGPCHNPACTACDAQGAVRHTGEDMERAEAARPAGRTAPPATTPSEAAPGETVARNP
ncbi:MULTISPECIES: hypothetical protein [unclassified Streptomyces]|uniref:hypothetical protein n=1 Tax=unclassified Streptomyces TaxID=2593676 RepID=UPI0033AEC0C8